MLTVLYFLITLGLIVLIHEAGHFFFARRAGVKVEVFSICFGKPLIKWKDKLGTQWQIGWIPLGGYVKMLGQEDGPADLKEKKLTAEEKKQHFAYKSWWQRFSIIIGGVLFNFISAILIIFCLYYFIGVPKTPAVISSISENSPAQISGLKTGDKIVKFNNNEIKDFKALQKNVALNQDKEAVISVIRDSKEIAVNITPKKSGKIYLLGITSTVSNDDLKKLPFVQTIKESGREFYSQISSMLIGIKQLIVGDRSSKELGGFLKIAEISKESADAGLFNFLFFIAVISINLGLLNLFPIPVLDGGHIVFLIIEAIRGKQMSDKLYNVFAYAGLAMLLFLMAFSNLNDILGLLRK